MSLIEPHDQIIADIIAALGYDAARPPVTISRKETATALNVKSGTLSVWASTGRYQLPFQKIGRRARYRIDDLAAFIVAQRRTSTSHVA